MFGSPLVVFLNAERKAALKGRTVTARGTGNTETKRMEGHPVDEPDGAANVAEG